jgi:dipeptidase E
MAHKRLLLLSNSTNYGERYLGYPESAIKDFLGLDSPGGDSPGRSPRRVLFIPFAGVRISFAEYTATVGERFREMGYELESVHEASDPAEAVRHASAIAVGGGNTFHLLRGLYETGLIEHLRARVEDGVPYIGWSAGSNVACPTIKTTNDMPIVEPPSLRALNLIPFQINPHYTDAQPVAHAGETRDQRLAEFLEVNADIYVIGLREGTILRVEDTSVKLLGDQSARVFLKGRETRDYTPQDSLDFLLHRP